MPSPAARTAETRAQERPFRRLSGYLAARYGERVYKVSLHAGFTCPNRDGTVGSGGCTFCYQPAIEPVGHLPGQPIAQQLQRGMEYIRHRHGARRFIAYFQDYSATYAPAARLAALYRPALDSAPVVGLAISTRPDCLSTAILDLLCNVAASKDLWVELGLQIAADQLLRRLNRGHTVADFARAATACQARGLPVCAHVIIGLPGASAQMERETAALLADLGIWGVKLHAFHVVEGTVMARHFARGEIELLTREQYARRVVEFVERLPAEMVIHRLTAEAPRRLTVAPRWTINKMAVFDEVVATFAQRATWQGRLATPQPR